MYSQKYEQNTFLCYTRRRPKTFAPQCTYCSYEANTASHRGGRRRAIWSELAIWFQPSRTHRWKTCEKCLKVFERPPSFRKTENRRRCDHLAQHFRRKNRISLRNTILFEILRPLKLTPFVRVIPRTKKKNRFEEGNLWIISIRWWSWTWTFTWRPWRSSKDRKSPRAHLPCRLRC